MINADIFNLMTSISLNQLLLLALINGDTQRWRRVEAELLESRHHKEIESHGDFTHFLIMLSIDPHKSLTGIQLPLTTDQFAYLKFSLSL